MENENNIQTNHAPKKKPIENTSGRGKNAPVPRVIAQKFNWAAFLLNWIWGIGNRTYITLIILVLSFIPVIGLLAVLPVAIWFGFKGNTWAWQNKHWKGINHFMQVQKKWQIASFILLGISAILFLVFIFGTVATIGTISNQMQLTPSLQSSSGYTINTTQNGYTTNNSSATSYTNFVVDRKKAINKLEKALKDNAAFTRGKHIPFTSEGLSEYVNLSLGGTQTGRGILLGEYRYWFTGDNECTNNSCIVEIDINGKKGPNKLGEDKIKLTLIKGDSMGYRILTLDRSQVQAYTRK